jgi:hypothetical protein
MERAYKQKLHSNVQINFSRAGEISYWAKKLNIESHELQKQFEHFDFSMSKVIAHYQNGNHITNNNND